MKNNMRKFIIIPLVIMTFFTCINFVSATSYVTMPSGGKNVRERPTQNSGLVKFLSENTKAELLETGVKGEGNSGCSKDWYKIKDLDDGRTGYICSAQVSVTELSDVDYNGDFEQQMLNQGFTPSYLPYLKTLHQKHPNWTFKAIKTGLDYNSSIGEQYTYGNSLVDGSDESLRSRDSYVYDASTGQYLNRGWDNGWYAASWDTISYYMDPRNFLNEQYIFMFETLSYNSSYQTKDGVKTIFKGSYMERYQDFDYAQEFVNAGSAHNVSPLHLASRVSQETGKNGNLATSGAEFTYEIDYNCRSRFAGQSDWTITNSCGNNQKYSSLYNFFSIGAYGSYKTPSLRGLIWANGGYDQSEKSYNRPWNTKSKAISGGAQYLSNNYISKGQDTLYFERFNVKPGAVNSTYTHQYMTNIRAHASEAYKNYNSYVATNSLGLNFEFLIPVYNNMPNETSIPTKPPVSKDESVNVPSVSLDTVKGRVGGRYDGSYMSNISIGKTAADLNAAAKSANASASVTVKSSNGSVKSGVIGTGDKIIISNGQTTSEYTAIIYGDSNGDGKITIVDLLRVQKIILNSVNLSAPYLKAADTNKDGKVTIVDLLRVQKHILGSITITQ